MSLYDKITNNKWKANRITTVFLIENCTLDTSVSAQKRQVFCTKDIKNVHTNISTTFLTAHKQQVTTL